jgi:hypothetical protein
MVDRGVAAATVQRDPAKAWVGAHADEVAASPCSHVMKYGQRAWRDVVMMRQAMRHGRDAIDLSGR